MMKAPLMTMLVIMASLWMAGCSASSPIEPQPPASIAQSGTGDAHICWGYYDFYIDPVTPKVEVIPQRQVMKHFNVKSYVTPPACNDCLIVDPTGPFQDHILPIDVTLKNPTPIKGYDVRGILISNDAGVALKNADNYTDLFDDGGTVEINPFKAYAKLVPDRSFAADDIFTESYQLFLSSFGKISKISYAIDASWPTRPKEPYSISQISMNGILDNYGLYTVTVSVEVLAAGGDVDEVTLDASSLGFAPDFVLTNVSGVTWAVDLTNSNLSPAGNYSVLVKASTASTTQYLYSYDTIAVTSIPTPVSFSTDVQPMFNLYCTTCHQSIMPPEDLDLTTGHSYEGLVNVDSKQCAFKRVKPSSANESYLIAKLNGTQLGPPFNGSGFQMPKTGGPLEFEQLIVFSTWVDQGAHNN